MTAERTTLIDRVVGYLDRPVVDRAAILMWVLAGGHWITVWLAYAVLASGDIPESGVWVPMMLSICGIVTLSAAWLQVVRRDDPYGERLPARCATWFAVAGFAVCGTGMAYGFGLASSPFTALPVVWIILVAIVIDRPRALLALATTAISVVALESLRLSRGWELAPALPPLSDDLLGSWQSTVGSAIGIVGYAVVTALLAFAVLEALDRQRDALESTHALIRTYVPAQVADVVLAGGGEPTALERRKLTIFFSDVVSFTETTESTEPEDLARVLDDYFSEMTRIAEKYDGTIDELIGDAVLIFFGAPTATDDRDHALRATRMAVEMQAAVSRLNEEWAAAGIDAVFEVRMGLSTAMVTVGNVGSGSRRKYAALGRGVNLAARIQTHCPSGGVLLSRPTWLLVRDDVPCRAEGAVELKGVGRSTELYSVDLSAAAVGE